MKCLSVLYYCISNKKIKFKSHLKNIPKKVHQEGKSSKFILDRYVI